MTDADDAGLVEALASAAWYHGNDTAHALPEGIAESKTIEAEARAALLERLATQRREIEALRRERDLANEAWKGTRCAELREQTRAEKAEAELAEAMEIIEPLVAISKAYDANELDNGARRYWGPNLEFEEFRGPNQIELYAGRGGKELLTLGHCKAASAFAAKHGGRDGQS